VARTFAVAKAAQQITFDALPDKTIGDADFNLNAGASSSLPVAFVAEGNCTLTGTQVHLTAAGQCTITAHRMVPDYTSYRIRRPLRSPIR
jgi:hypothetical protein